LLEVRVKPATLNAHRFYKGGIRQARPIMLFHFVGMAMLAGLAGLVVYELVSEVRGAGQGLHDHYHE
jgi:hypothetical protein